MRVKARVLMHDTPRRLEYTQTNHKDIFQMSPGGCISVKARDRLDFEDSTLGATYDRVASAMRGASYDIEFIVREGCDDEGCDHENETSPCR